MSYGLYFDYYNISADGTKLYSAEMSSFGTASKACLENAVITFKHNQICATLFMHQV